MGSQRSYQRKKGVQRIMKSRALMTMLLGLVVFGWASTAAAVPQTWEDTVDANPNKIQMLQWYSYAHDLTDNTPIPFVVGQDAVKSYSLEVYLKDDLDNQREIALVFQPWMVDRYDFRFTSNTYGFSLQGLTTLNSYGGLQVAIFSLYGDFYFDKSVLTATGDSPTAPVPEPSTLMLLGSGLSGLGVWQVYRRKPKSKS